MAEYVVVIDPGHGSLEYPGASYGAYIEKDLALLVSNVIKSRLEEYDNVKVYLTRNTDVVVGLKDRADIAKAYEADLFISIHFNASSNHEFFGSEVWLPIERDLYNKTYPMANEILNNLSAMGFYSRGIKTKASSLRNANYYTVLSQASKHSIPSMIIEHCYLDNSKDTGLLPVSNSSEYANAIQRIGIGDAEAIAKCLHLSSSSLGISYKDYRPVESRIKKRLIMQDETPANQCEVKILSYNPSSGQLTFEITASDPESAISYYKYSLDGGNSFSRLMAWTKRSNNESEGSVICTVKAPKSTNPALVAIVYNSYDLTQISNVASVSSEAISQGLKIYEAQGSVKLIYDTLSRKHSPNIIPGAITDALMLIAFGMLMFSIIKNKLRSDRNENE